MIQADTAPWRPREDGIVGSLRQAYQAMTPQEMPDELRRVVARLEEASSTPSDGRLALIAQADQDGRARAAALLEEAEFDVIECASAEAALAVLVNEADRASFLLADRELAGERDAEALTSVVRLLWPQVHVAAATLGAEEARHLDPNGVARLSRPWRGLDLLVEAERAMARVA